MDWYIITKQKMTAREAFMFAVGNKINKQLRKLFQPGDIFSDGGSPGKAGKYDKNPQLIIKSGVEYPNYDESISPLIKELKKDKVVYVVLSSDAAEAVQHVYLSGLIYSGERDALLAQCPKTEKTNKPPSGPPPGMHS